MINNIHNPEQSTWKEIGYLVWKKLFPERFSKSKDQSKDSIEFDRSHLRDWHTRTLADEEPIPEVEHYKEYIRNESEARKHRELVAEKHAQRVKHEKESKGSNKSRKKHKTKYQNHKKRGRR